MMSLFQRSGSKAAAGGGGSSSSSSSSSPNSVVATGSRIPSNSGSSSSSSSSSTALSGSSVASTGTTSVNSTSSNSSSLLSFPQHPLQNIFQSLSSTPFFSDLINLYNSLFGKFLNKYTARMHETSQQFFLSYPDVSHFIGMGLLGVCMFCFYKARRRMRDIEAVQSVPYTPLADLPMLLRTVPSEEGYIVKARGRLQTSRPLISPLTRNRCSVYQGHHFFRPLYGSLKTIELSDALVSLDAPMGESPGSPGTPGLYYAGAMNNSNYNGSMSMNSSLNSNGISNGMGVIGGNGTPNNNNLNSSVKTNKDLGFRSISGSSMRNGRIQQGINGSSSNRRGGPEVGMENNHNNHNSHNNNTTSASTNNTLPVPSTSNPFLNFADFSATGLTPPPIPIMVFLSDILNANHAHFCLPHAPRRKPRLFSNETLELRVAQFCGERFISCLLWLSEWQYHVGLKRELVLPPDSEVFLMAEASIVRVSDGYNGVNGVCEEIGVGEGGTFSDGQNNANASARGDVTGGGADFAGSFLKKLDQLPLVSTSSGLCKKLGKNLGEMVTRSWSKGVERAFGSSASIISQSCDSSVVGREDTNDRELNPDEDRRTPSVANSSLNNSQNLSNVNNGLNGNGVHQNNSHPIHHHPSEEDISASRGSITTHSAVSDVSAREGSVGTPGVGTPGAIGSGSSSSSASGAGSGIATPGPASSSASSRSFKGEDGERDIRRGDSRGRGVERKRSVDGTEMLNMDGRTKTTVDESSPEIVVSAEVVNATLRSNNSMTSSAMMQQTPPPPSNSNKPFVPPIAIPTQGLSANLSQLSHESVPNNSRNTNINPLQEESNLRAKSLYAVRLGVPREASGAGSAANGYTLRPGRFHSRSSVVTFFMSNLSEERLIKLWETQQRMWIGASVIAFISGFSLLAMRHLTLHKDSKILDILKWLGFQAAGVCGLVWWLKEEEYRRYEHKFSLFRAAFGSTPPGLKPSSKRTTGRISGVSEQGLLGFGSPVVPGAVPLAGHNGVNGGGVGTTNGFNNNLNHNQQAVNRPAIRINQDIDRLKDPNNIMTNPKNIFAAAAAAASSSSSTAPPHHQHQTSSQAQQTNYFDPFHDVQSNPSNRRDSTGWASTSGTSSGWGTPGWATPGSGTGWHSPQGSFDLASLGSRGSSRPGSALGSDHGEQHPPHFPPPHNGHNGNHNGINPYTQPSQTISSTTIPLSARAGSSSSYLNGDGGPRSSPALRFAHMKGSSTLKPSGNSFESFVDAIEPKLEEELSDIMLAGGNRTRPSRNDVGAFQSVAMPAFSSNR